MSSQLLLFERLATEGYPMNQSPRLGSDGYGHLISARGASSKTISSETSHSGEPDESEARPADDLIFQNAAAKSPIQRILIPIDATQVKAADLKPVLKVAQRFDAEVTLLHCYEIPLSFHYAVGRSALVDVALHSDLVRTQLLQLCAEVRKFFASCRSEFALGSLPVEILCASQRLQSDLIVVPLALDLGSSSWTTKEIIDELVRKADCPVVGIPFQSEEPVVSIRHPEDSI
jgi:nucleotide-binding universal stress UspA family protein